MQTQDLQICCKDQILAYYVHLHGMMHIQEEGRCRVIVPFSVKIVPLFSLSSLDYAVWCINGKGSEFYQGVPITNADELHDRMIC